MSVTVRSSRPSVPLKGQLNREFIQSYTKMEGIDGGGANPEIYGQWVATPHRHPFAVQHLLCVLLWDLFMVQEAVYQRAFTLPNRQFASFGYPPTPHPPHLLAPHLR